MSTRGPWGGERAPKATTALALQRRVPAPSSICPHWQGAPHRRQRWPNGGCFVLAPCPSASHWWWDGAVIARKQVDVLVITSVNLLNSKEARSRQSSRKRVRRQDKRSMRMRLMEWRASILMWKKRCSVCQNHFVQAMNALIFDVIVVEEPGVSQNQASYLHLHKFKKCGLRTQ